jgi:hypothetical protein
MYFSFSFLSTTTTTFYTEAFSFLYSFWTLESFSPDILVIDYFLEIICPTILLRARLYHWPQYPTILSFAMAPHSEDALTKVSTDGIWTLRHAHISLMYSANLGFYSQRLRNSSSHSTPPFNPTALR